MPPPSKEHIEELVYKFNTGTITRLEYEELVDWYKSFDDETVRIPRTDQVNDVKERILSNILQKTETPASLPAKRMISWKPIVSWSIVAATILLAGTWIATQHNSKNVNSTAPIAAIIPGGNKAILTLPDGQSIPLESTQHEIRSSDQITYSDGTALLSPHNQKELNSQHMLTLQTPKGGTYSIVLSDGSQVWLNADSKLIYPAKFQDDKRTVELTGEAYFKIKPNYNRKGEKIAFIVKSSNQEVKVLGTEFNLSDYPNQPRNHTTLIEGKVSVSTNAQHYILAPNQRLLTDANKSSLQQVNTRPIIAWKNGKFDFEDKSIQEILTEIGLWYNLEIIYEGPIPHVELLGDAYRHESFNWILDLLEVSRIDYSLDKVKRRLIIKGTNKNKTT